MLQKAGESGTGEAPRGESTIQRESTSPNKSISPSGASPRSESILDIPLSRLTPGMKQYQDVKKEHPDCLIMLRMGDFYEMFYQDAETASRELEITLTARGTGEKRAPLAGIPFHALDSYLGTLVKKGHKVAIVEQLEDPKLAKGLVKRGLVRIVTPGTMIDASMLEEKENNYIAAVRAAGQFFFVAFCDISTGEFITAHLQGESSLRQELARYHPRECIIPASLQVNDTIAQILRQGGTFLQCLDDASFNLEITDKVLCDHFVNYPTFGLSAEHSRVSGALLAYMQGTQQNTLTHIRFIRLQSDEQAMLLDSSTMRNLELLKNREGSTKGTLLSVLDKTITPMGGRLLKSWIKEPLLKKEPIDLRLDAVEELSTNVMMHQEVRDLLRNMGDMERLIGRINYGNANPRDLLSLRQSLQQLPALRQALLRGKGLLKELASFDALQELAGLLQKALRDDAPLSLREGGIIKEVYSSELDQLQELKKNSRSYLARLEEEERQKTGIPTLHLGFTKVFGYFIEITKRHQEKVPLHYIRKQTTVNGERYITEELKMEEEKIMGASEKIEALEYQLFQELLRIIQQKTKEIQDAAQRVAVFDALSSFATVAIENHYTKPLIFGEQALSIKNGRHPVVEQEQEQFVPNSVFLQPGEMMIITGPNMAGKSTVMRQTALIVLMAQMGSFVPAEEAAIGIVDRVFTRVGAHDDLSSGQSTFMVEMQETANILHNATERSLVILDEIGRGTSTFDGVSIAWSVAEHIVQNLKAKTLFATHYHVLNKLAERFPRISNYNVAAKEVDGDVLLLHKLVPGGTDQSFGIHVAKLAGVPAPVVERAKEIQRMLEKDDQLTRKIKVKKLEEQQSLSGFADAPSLP